MNKQRNIVSFEDVRRSAAKRAGSSASASKSNRRSARTNPASIQSFPGGANKAGRSIKATKANSTGVFGSSNTTGAVGKPISKTSKRTKDGVEPAVTVASKAGFFERRKESKKRKNKAKAEKAFEKAYGESSQSRSGALGAGSAGVYGASGGASGAGMAGPRAAVYRGQMGSKQRRASRIQEKSAPSVETKASPKRFSFDIRNLPASASKIVGVVACIAVFVAFLYVPAQQYYQQMRERDRLAAEYAAIQQRNDALQETVDALQSEAGIEDKAHSEFGYVKEGEQAVAVTGVELEDTSRFTANIVPGTVPAPETWYSPFLDPLFGYSQ